MSTTVSPSVSPVATAANTTSYVAPTVSSTHSTHPQPISTTSTTSSARPVVVTPAVEPEPEHRKKKSLDKFAPKTTNVAKFHLKMPNGEVSLNKKKSDRSFESADGVLLYFFRESLARWMPPFLWDTCASTSKPPYQRVV